MAKSPTLQVEASNDRRLRTLEVELKKVTERFRLAKLAVREAKAVAKAARKEAKRVRKDLAAAQERREVARTATKKAAKKKTTTKAKATPASRRGAKASVASAPIASPKRRIADSPEKVRRPRRKRKSAQVDVAAPAAPTNADPQTSESSITGDKQQ